ncbi:hypothetical protein [Kordiimonas pumila]|uniref:Uncharacterized protein n=1 Tax=Kordiimonas pumila TaxID=2161677 RepID=A0ABV7D3Q5_9PROT|nr:hypothetical protein [Kordiimonas pumila]
MAGDDYYSGEKVTARAAEKRQVDFDDLQHELAGRDNGKISRFVTDEERKRRSGKTASDKVFQTMLDAMLADPAYAAAYQDTMNAINDADSAVYDAMVESADKLHDASDALEDARERGASPEEIARLQKEYEDAKERHRRMQEYEAELAAIRARMENENDPPSPEELEALKKRAIDIQEGVQPDLTSNNELKVSKPQDTSVPDLPLGSP